MIGACCETPMEYVNTQCGQDAVSGTYVKLTAELGFRRITYVITNFIVLDCGYFSTCRMFSFGVIPRRLNFICRRFGTLCLFHLHKAGRWWSPTSLWRWNRQSVPKRRHIKFRRRGITQKKTYNIQNTAKVWNQEYFSTCLWEVTEDCIIIIIYIFWVYFFFTTSVLHVGSVTVWQRSADEAKF